jgi:ketosteroid isomerase-like protein
MDFRRKSTDRPAPCGVERRRTSREVSAESAFPPVTHRSERVLPMHTTSETQSNGAFLDFGTFLELREAAAKEYEAGDVEPLRQLATRHPPATLFASDGAIRLGPDRVSEAYEQRVRSDGETHFELLQSAASDGLAYWVGLQHSTARCADSDTPRHIVMRVTELFRREKGEWKLIHRHADELEVAR